MSVPFLWSVSPHICRWGSIGQLLQLMALTLSGWKPIHHTGKVVGKKQRGERGEERKDNGGTVLHGVKRLFITEVPLSGSLPVYPWGQSSPCQTHLGAQTWRNGPSWNHTDKLQASWGRRVFWFQFCQIPMLWSNILFTEGGPRCDTLSMGIRGHFWKKSATWRHLQGVSGKTHNLSRWRLNKLDGPNSPPCC